MAEPEITVRNLRFPHHEVPRNWLGNRPAVARFFDQLSLIFPRGERFFIDSVRPFEEQLPPALREQVRAFIQQEAMHSREHQQYNERLARFGYPTTEIIADITRMADGMSRWPLTRQLAFTCAIEHFTAVLAQFALESDEMFGEAHPVMSALWRWHAVEETEHAAVAFDVFEAMGGSYAERAAVMLYATFVFWGRVALRQPKMLKTDGTLWSLKSHWDLMVFLFGRPGIARRSLKPYLAYFRRDFHPRQLETEAMVARWRAEFETSPVYREVRSAKPKKPASVALRAAS